MLSTHVKARCPGVWEDLLESGEWDEADIRSFARWIADHSNEFVWCREGQFSPSAGIFENSLTRFLMNHK